MAQTSGFEKTTFFITYDGMIKNFQLTLLEILRSDIMKDKYNDILKIDILQELNVDELEGICLASESENILATIGRRMDVNYGAMLLDLFNKFPDLFSESKLLPLGQSINILNRQSFMDKIYLYTPVYDERIYMDIGDTFGDSKVVYVYGDFEDVINMIPQRITAYALNDIKYIDRIINANKIHMTEIILGMYGYNYITNSDGKMELSRNIKELQENNVFKFILHNPFPNSKGVYDIILDDKQ